MSQLHLSIFTKKDRMQSICYWGFYPIFLSSLYLCISLSHTLSTLNPHMDYHTHVPQLSAKKLPTSTVTTNTFHGIWLSVRSISKGILIQLPGEPDLVWNRSPYTMADVSASLTKYLKKHVQHLYLKTALSQRVTLEDATVKIAADQALQYGDLAPVFDAIAIAGLSQYAFEVQTR